MRYISHIRQYAVGIVAHVTENTTMGQRVVVQGYTANFSHADVTAEELLFAERAFKGIHGRTLERDEVTQTAMIGRLSTFDTESDKTLAEFAAVDEANLGIPIPGRRNEVWEYGTTQRLTEAKLADRAGGDFLAIETKPLSPPWPTYNEFRGSITDLVERIFDDGYHIPEVIAYEKSALKRKDVIEALEELQASVADANGTEVVPA